MSLGILVHILENICTILFLITFHFCSGLSFNCNMAFLLFNYLNFASLVNGNERVETLLCIRLSFIQIQFLHLILLLGQLGEKNIIIFITIIIRHTTFTS